VNRGQHAAKKPTTVKSSASSCVEFSWENECSKVGEQCQLLLAAWSLIKYLRKILLGLNLSCSVAAMGNQRQRRTYENSSFKKT